MYTGKILAVVAGLILLEASSPVVAETVQTAQKGLLARYADGTADRYSVKYSGTVDVQHYESGEAFHCDLSNCHPYDDRQCHWSISSYVRRDVCLVSHNGATYCEGQLSIVYNTSTQNQGSTFVVTQLRPENCGDAQGRFDSDVANARQGMANVFPSIVQKDSSVVSSTIQTKTGASSVSAAP